MQENLGHGPNPIDSVVGGQIGSKKSPGIISGRLLRSSGVQHARWQVFRTDLFLRNMRKRAKLLQLTILQAWYPRFFLQAWHPRFFF